MIILPPYINDYQVYPQCTTELKLFHNKMWLAEQLGYVCGPTGIPTPQGKFCVRPIYNIGGMGAGGFYEYDTSALKGGLNNHPGYFWCEWFEGRHTYGEYVNDEPIVTALASEGDIQTFSYTDTHVPVPEFAKGKSRYMMIEAVGGKIVEISFRHPIVAARQESIDDYRTIDPTYDPQDLIFGLTATQEKRVAPPFPPIRGYVWHTPELDPE